MDKGRETPEHPLRRPSIESGTSKDPEADPGHGASGRGVRTRAMREIFAGLPWWVKWVAVPVIALFVFGGLILSVLHVLVTLLFKALLFVALVGGLIYVVRKFMAGSSSRGDW
jgi:hypothetical protein